MKALRDFIPPATMRSLITDVLDAYDPRGTVLNLRDSRTVTELGTHLETLLGCRLRFFRAFLLLVADTTIETATRNPAEGWHVDSSCGEIDGDCYNLWVPLYNSASGTGVEVLAAQDNAEVYERLGDPRLPLEIITRAGAPDVFERLRIGSETDLIVVRRGSSGALLLAWHDLVIRRFEDPRVGDVSVFRQTDIHRGFHGEGIRIQLSLKYTAAAG